MRRLILFWAIVSAACPLFAQLGPILEWFPQQYNKEKNFIGCSIEHANAGPILLENSKRTLAGVDVAMCGIYIGYYTNGDKARETIYGAGKYVSDEHRIDAYNFGCMYRIAEGFDYTIDVLPYIQMMKVRDRMVDAYYGESKYVASHVGTGLGIGALFNMKYFTLWAKASTYSVGIGLAINFSL